MSEVETSPKPTVVMVHGYGASPWVMFPLARQMRKLGYNVHNWGYRSLWKDIQHHSARLRKEIEELEASELESFHFVSHSMGGILIRVLLETYSPAKLRRIVMITPPNGGSHQATRFSPVFGWLSKTLTQIQDEAESFVNRLNFRIPSCYEVGIIQAQHDLVVAPDCTHLPEATEMLQLPGFHSSVLWRKRTSRFVDRYLQTGTFEE